MPDKLKWLLHYHFVRGDFSGCQKAVNYALHNCETDSANLMQGRIHRAEGRLQEALRCFQICYERNSSNPECLKELAICLIAQKRYLKAIEALNQASLLQPRPDFTVHHSLASCYAALKNYALAEKCCKDALAVYQNKEVYKLLTSCLVEQNKMAEALDVFRAALRSYPKSSALYANFGRLCSRMSFEEEALKNLTTSVKLNADNTLALLELAYIYQKRDQQVEAIELYRKALVLGSDSPFVYNNMGLCYFTKNRYVLALTCLLRARELAPSCPEVLFNIGLVYASLRQYCSAMIHWRTSEVCLAARNLQADAELGVLTKSCTALLDDENGGH